MSELTAEQAIEILEGDRWPGREVDCIHIARLIRTESARVAELEKELSQSQANLEAWNEELTVVKNHSDAQAIRIEQLEFAARWRSCKEEPPEAGKQVLCRRSQVDFYHTYIQGSFDGSKWIAALGGPMSPPDEWRKIE
jgi:hypothetical protein